MSQLQSIGIGSFPPLQKSLTCFLIFASRQTMVLRANWLASPATRSNGLLLALNGARCQTSTGRRGHQMLDMDMETQGTATKRLMRSSRLHLT